jgi:hypothetical protein
MARLIIWVDVRDKKTNHVFRRELEWATNNITEAVQAFDRGEAYETENYFLTKHKIQPSDVKYESTESNKPVPFYSEIQKIKGT